MIETGKLEGFQKYTSRQRLNDIKNNACFVCHKSGCCPWTRRQNVVSRSVNVVSIRIGHDHDDVESNCSKIIWSS